MSGPLRSRTLRACVALAGAATLALSLPVMGHAATSSVRLYTGPMSAGVPTTWSDRGHYRSCPNPAPGQPFPTATPEEVGLDAGALQEAANYHSQRLQETFWVVRFGCLVKTGNVNALFDHTPKHQWSVTKAVSTAVLGRAVTLGYIGIEDTVGKYFPNLGDGAHRAITVNQLLHHTQGTHMNWTREFQLQNPDRLTEFASLPIEHQPGTYFQYSQTGPAVLNAMVEKAVGEDFQKFAQDQLFTPLGIKRPNWYWMRDQAGNTEGYSLLHMRPLDMVTFGQFLLQSGSWAGRQLVDPQFYRDALRGSDSNPAFGYQTWVNAAPRHVTIALTSREQNNHCLVPSAPNDMYMTWGWRGRHQFMMPNLGMMVVSTPFDHDFDYSLEDVHTFPGAQGEQGEGYHEFFRILMRAVRDQRIADPGPWTYGGKAATTYDAKNYVEPDQTVDSRSKPSAFEGKGVLQNLQDYPQTALNPEAGPFVPFH